MCVCDCGPFVAKIRKCEDVNMHSIIFPSIVVGELGLHAQLSSVLVVVVMVMAMMVSAETQFPILRS